MAGLTGKTIASAYKSILRVNDDTNGIDTAVESITDGEGTASCLKLSDDAVEITPNNDDTTAGFCVKNKAGGLTKDDPFSSNFHSRKILW